MSPPFIDCGGMIISGMLYVPLDHHGAVLESFFS